MHMSVMYTYMHMSVDQQVSMITDIYATVTTYATFGQSKISIKTKSEYDKHQDQCVYCVKQQIIGNAFL
jgi:hypothetical protein